MMDCGSTILIFIAFIQATCGQSVTLTGPPAVEQESETVYTCTGGAAPYIFIWTDISVSPNVLIFTAGGVTYPAGDTKYLNFGVVDNGGTSTMTISNTAIEDEGQYRCSEGAESDEANLAVEVQGTWSVSPASPIKSNINDMFEATCEAVGGRPEETITWMLGDGTIPCDDPGAVDPTPGPGLSSKTSICTFQATSQNNNGQTLICVITGHNVSSLNGEVTTTLETHRMPTTDITVGFQSTDTSLTVSCVIADPTQPIPSIRNYYIYSNDSLIHQSSTEDNNVVVEASEFDLYTNFTCVAGNYIGNVTSPPTRYDPTSTTTPPPVTAQETTTTPVVKDKNSGGVTATQPSMTTNIDVTDPREEDPKTQGLPAGAIAGIAIGCIFCIVIIVVIVLFLLKPECCPCFGGSGTPPPSNKPSGRAVGSSNGSGSEKDVESPLNGVKDVTAEEKLPQAAPRGHGSIQHTNDNPDQAMYAMVDKKPARGGGGAGDAPDRGSAPGQNEPPGMLYADLDLSHKAGHTDKHVPKNENDVVVYSSILV